MWPPRCCRGHSRYVCCLMHASDITDHSALLPAHRRVHHLDASPAEPRFQILSQQQTGCRAPPSSQRGLSLVSDKASKRVILLLAVPCWMGTRRRAGRFSLRRSGLFYGSSEDLRVMSSPPQMVAALRVAALMRSGSGFLCGPRRASLSLSVDPPM